MVRIGDMKVVFGREDLGKVTVDEIEGNRAFVRLRNGVEMDFDLSLLRAPPPPSNINEEWYKSFIDSETDELGSMYHEAITRKNHPNLPEWKKTKVEIKVDILSKLAGMPSKDLYQKLVHQKLKKGELFTLISRKLIQTGKQVHLNKLIQERQAVAA